MRNIKCKLLFIAIGVFLVLTPFLLLHHAQHEGLDEDDCTLCFIGQQFRAVVQSSAVRLELSPGPVTTLYDIPIDLLSCLHSVNSLIRAPPTSTM